MSGKYEFAGGIYLQGSASTNCELAAPRGVPRTLHVSYRYRF